MEFFSEKDRMENFWKKTKFSSEMEIFEKRKKEIKFLEKDKTFFRNGNFWKKTKFSSEIEIFGKRQSTDKYCLTVV